MGRNARGVRGIKLSPNQRVISLLVPSPDSSVLTSTMHGYGKRTLADDYPAKGRGNQGVISIKTTERNGEVVGAIIVGEDDEVMLISDRGTLIRTPVRDVSILGRNTQGVRLVAMGEGERLAGLQRISQEEEAIEEEEASATDAASADTEVDNDSSED